VNPDTLENIDKSNLVASFYNEEHTPFKPRPLKPLNFAPLILATMDPAPTHPTPNKEFALNKPSFFLGDRKKIRSFLRECGLYLHVN